MKLIVPGTFVAFAALVIIGLISASRLEGTSVESLQKARILQLEQQVQALTSVNAVCGARLLLATQAQTEQEQQAKRDSLERELGCAVQWDSVPPVCKPVPEASK